MSIGILNKSPNPYKVCLDFSKSKNLLFSTKTSKVEKVQYIKYQIVNPGQYEFFMHFYLLVDDYGSKNVENLGYNIFLNPIK